MANVFVVGPLPPPVHGFAVINQAMLDVLVATGSKVGVFDVKPSGFAGLIFNWFRFASKALGVCFKNRCVLYLPLSGGLRQCIDFAYLLLAVLLKFDVYFHHHSFAYLNRPSRITKLLCKLAPQGKHVVLGEAMASLLFSQYKVNRSNVVVLSNSAFMPTSTTYFHELSNKKDFVIGYLSNITIEKGIFVFFDLVEKLNAKGYKFTAQIAGPVSKEIEEGFNLCLKGQSNVCYVGAVYSDDKSKFYAGLDALIFPTMYINEAEPVTIWEAFASGVPVFAFNRGSIKDIVPANAGGVADNLEQLSELVSAFMINSKQPSNLLKYKNNARDHFEQASNIAHKTLHTLIAEMTAN